MRWDIRCALWDVTHPLSHSIDSASGALELVLGAERRLKIVIRFR